MHTIFFEKTSELKRTKEELEKKLEVKITIQGRKVTFSGDSLQEYEASIILDAISFGFSAKKALFLKDENMIFRIINIKTFTRKKNLREVRARVIGKEGKTKKTIENISNCHLIIKDKEIGVICSSESIEKLTTALSSLVRGAKQANTYRFLEKMNKNQRHV